MALILVTPPAILPVTISDAKIHERIDVEDTANDNSIDSMLHTATRLAEEFTRRAFITQTWLYQTTCRQRCVEIPRPILREVDEVSFTTFDDVTTVIDDTTYFINPIPEPGLLIFKSGFPFSFGGFGGFLTVQFDAGYGDTADDVPFPIKEGILQIFGHLYENRESQMMPGGAIDILSPFKVEYL